MNEEDKKDWIVEHYSGTWQIFVDPDALYDALHAYRPGRIAEVLRNIISRHCDAAGKVTDPAGLVDELREIADALGAR